MPEISIVEKIPNDNNDNTNDIPHMQNEVLSPSSGRNDTVQIDIESDLGDDLTGIEPLLSELGDDYHLRIITFRQYR